MLTFLSTATPTSHALDLAQAAHQYQDTEFSVVDISEGSYDDGPAIAVTFSVPLNPNQKFSDYLDISLKDGPRVKGGWLLSDSATTAYFTNTEPKTEYTVTVYSGLLSVTGKTIGQNIHQTVKTRDLKPSVAFASQGHLLPAGHSQGLPVYTINVQEVDVDFHRVKADNITQFLRQWQERQSQRHWQLQRYTPMMDLVFSGRFQLDPPKNKRHRTNLPVKDIAALGEPGLYVAVMNAAGDYPHTHQVSYFVVSDIGIHARFYPQRIDVHINALEDATPLGGAQLSLLNDQGQVVGQTRSTPDGLASFHHPQKSARVLLAQKDDHIAVLRLYGPALDLSEFDLGDRPNRATEAFVYGPRDLYRPGENVIFNALLRDHDGQLQGNTPLRAILRAPDHREAQNTVWHGNELAYYHHEFALPRNAATGQWQLQLKIGSQVVGEYRFKVEEFLPERMKLTLADGIKTPGFLTPQSPLTIAAEGMYLYGAPAAGNRLSSLVVIRQQRHPVDALKDFHFGDIQEHAKAQRIELPDTHLDDSGHGDIAVDNRWQQTRSPLDIHVIASLYESGGRPVARDIHYTVWPSDALIGIRPLFGEDTLQTNTLAGFEIVKADRTGQLQPAQGLEVKLVREHRNYYWSYNDSRGWYREQTDKHYTAFSRNLDITGDRPTRVDAPVEWGTYRLEVRDPATGHMTSLRFTAGRWYATQAAESGRPDKIGLTLDQSHYVGGDTATVTLTPPYAGEGFIVVESDRPLWWQRITVPAGGTRVDIPIDPSWQQHNLYISAAVFRPVQQSDPHLPNRALGLVPLRLDRQSRQLDVSLTPNADKVEPLTTLRTTLKVNGKPSNGTPVMATVAAVDVGVLNITDFQTPDAHDWFFKQRRYGVDSRDIYGTIIDSLEGETARLRFGGDAELARGGKRAQSEVQIVSLFSGPVTLDDEGEAQIEFQLPDFNGKLRLMALAFGDDHYGSAQTQVTVAAPIVAEIAMPRFLAAGDRSTATLDVQNLSGAPQTLDIELTATPPLLSHGEPQRITLADGEKRVLSYPIAATAAFGQGMLRAVISNNVSDQQPPTIRLQRQWPLNVRPAYPAQTRHRRAALSDGEQLELTTELDGLLLNTVEGELTVTPHPPIPLNDHLRYLLSYPYGCLEQSISSTYPWLFATQDTIDRLGLRQAISNTIDPTKRLDYLQQGLQRIANLQHTSGGYGLWARGDREAHWLTAYAADFLVDAREQGVAVDDTLFNQTINRLLRYVNSNTGMIGERWSQNRDHYRFAYRSYAAYVLSRLNRAPLGSLRTLYEQHRRSTASGLPLVHLGIALINQGDMRRGKLAIAEGIATQMPTERYYFSGDYGSRVRDYAQMIYLLEDADLDINGRDELLFQLADALRSRSYLSTQERLALFKTGIALSQKTHTAWLGELILGKATERLEGYTTYNRGFSGPQLDNGLAFRSHNPQRLFAQLTVTGYPATAPEPRLDDINIVRDYYDLHGNPITQAAVDGQRSLPALNSGDMVVVHIRVNSRRRIPDALLVDLLPAGLELENQNLKHAVKLDNFTIDGKTVNQWQRRTQLLHQEYRDDRYVAAFDIHERQTVDLFYLARAVTPGTYTVPPVYVEDMYRPFIQGLSHSIDDLTVTSRPPQQQAN